MSYFLNICGASLPSFSVGIVPTSYSAESESTFAYFTGANELTVTEKTALDRFINGMSSVGNLSKIKGMQLNSALSNEGKALIDIISGVSATNNGAAYNKLTGFQTDGATSYVNTNLTPSLLLDKDSVGMFVYPLATPTVLSLGAISTSPNTHQLIVTYNESTRTLSSKISSSSSVPKVFPADYQMNKVNLGGTRITNARASTTYNGDVAVGINNSSVGLPNVPVYLGAQNYNSAVSFGAGNYGAFVLVDAVGFNYGAFNFYFEQMMVELGVVNADALYNISEAPVYDNSEVLLLNSEGQSNSLFAGKSEAPNYTELTLPIVGANIYYSYPLGATAVKGDLEYLVNHSNDAQASAYPQFAAGLRLSYELAKQPLEYHIWAYNKSGTPLAEQAGKDWNANSVSEYFDESTAIGEDVTTSIVKPIKKLVWHWNQGEGDGSRTEQEYTADLYAFLNKKITVYEANGINLSATDLHVIVTRIFIGLNANAPGVIAAQNNFNKASFEAAYPSQAGKIKTFAIYNNDKTWHSDGVHVASEGYHTEAYRLDNYISKL